MQMENFKFEEVEGVNIPGAISNGIITGITIGVMAAT